MIKKPAAYVLVVLQFLSIVYIVIAGSVVPLNVLYFSLYCVGVVLGIWSVWVMRKSKFQILPHVAHGSTLVTKGPYAAIRHPMYAAILLMCASLVLDAFSLPIVIAFAVLCVTLYLKIQYEEQMLATHFEGYAAYKKKTRSLIPYLF